MLELFEIRLYTITRCDTIKFMVYSDISLKIKNSKKSEMFTITTR